MKKTFLEKCIIGFIIIAGFIALTIAAVVVKDVAVWKVKVDHSIQTTETYDQGE